MLDVSYFLKEVLLQTFSRNCRHSWLVTGLIKIGKRYFFFFCVGSGKALLCQYVGVGWGGRGSGDCGNTNVESVLLSANFMIF